MIHTRISRQFDLTNWQLKNSYSLFDFNVRFFQNALKFIKLILSKAIFTEFSDKNLHIKCGARWILCIDDHCPVFTIHYVQVCILTYLHIYIWNPFAYRGIAIKIKPYIYVCSHLTRSTLVQCLTTLLFTAT